MAVRISWSPEALRDLDEIYAYLRQANPVAGRQVLRGIKERLSLLKNFPQSGRVVPELGRVSTRELVFSPYRLIYRYSVAEKLIEVSRIWHSARGAPDLPGRETP